MTSHGLFLRHFVKLHEQDANPKLAAADKNHVDELTDRKIDVVDETVEEESFVDGDESDDGSQYESFIPGGKNKGNITGI